MSHPGKNGRYRRAVVVSVLTAIATVLGSGRSEAVEGLRFKFKDLSKEVRGYLEGKGLQSIWIGNINGDTLYRAGKGPGLRLLLRQELEAQKVEVSPRAVLELELSYRLVPDEERSAIEGCSIPQIACKAVILNRNTLKGVHEIPITIRDEVDLPSEKLRDLICELFGVNLGNLPQDETIKQISTKLEREKERMVLAVEQRQKEANAEAPPRLYVQRGDYQVLVLVKSGDKYETRELVDQEGQPFVPLKLGEVYAVLLVNHSKHDAMVELSIDGLNAFQFSEFKGRYSQYLVRKGASLQVVGWHRNNEVSNEFLISKYADVEHASLLLGQPDAVGTITATFRAAWASEEEKPDDEKGRAKSPSGLATNQGQSRSSQFQEARLYVSERSRHTFTIRYDRPAGQVAIEKKDGKGDTPPKAEAPSAGERQ